MNGLCIIEGKVLVAWEKRLAAIEQNQLALMKLIQSIIPPPGNSSNIPGYIAPMKASKQYGKSLRTITINWRLLNGNTKDPSTVPGYAVNIA
jgi:hypothetical protein